MKRENEEKEKVKHSPVKRDTETDNTINVSYKVETKEIPKLPANKSLKGKNL